MADLSPAIEILHSHVRVRFADRRMINNGSRSEWRRRTRAQDVARSRLLLRVEHPDGDLSP